MPQGLNPEGLATSGLKDTTVVLPEGMAINPGQATGLRRASRDRPGADDLPPTKAKAKRKLRRSAECPAASKVGTDEIATPLLPSQLKGNVYVLQSNPPRPEAARRGLGRRREPEADRRRASERSDRQLTTTFENTPDAPFTEFELSFSGGAQAALVTPPTCRRLQHERGFHAVDQPVHRRRAVGKQLRDRPAAPAAAPCAITPLPFAPTLTAGSTTDQAGGYTDFSMLLQRGDGQQRIETLQFKAPEGLSGMIAKVPLCGEPQASAGTARQLADRAHGRRRRPRARTRCSSPKPGSRRRRST